MPSEKKMEPKRCPASFGIRSMHWATTGELLAKPAQFQLTGSTLLAAAAVGNTLTEKRTEELEKNFSCLVMRLQRQKEGDEERR